MDKITFGNKVDTKVTSVAEINKVTGANLNEIKSVTNLAVDQIANNKEDITSLINGNGKTYISVSNAMAASPLPSNNTPFTVRDSVSNLEDGFYIYSSTEVGGYKFLNTLEAITNGYYVVNSLLDFDSLISNASSGVWMIISDITLDANKTIPAGVTLQFRNAKINLGGFTLTGANTKIDAGLSQIFDTSGIISGFNVLEYYAEWFGAVGDGVTDDTASMDKAMALGVLKLNNKAYRYINTDNRIENVTIIGAKKPSLNATETGLEDGSIIVGTLLLKGKNPNIYNLGVDHGSDRFPSTQDNALALAHINPFTVESKATVINVVGLCANVEDPFHAILIEGHYDTEVSNILAVKSFFGCVLKNVRNNLNNAILKNNGSDNLIVKSDAVSGKVEKVNINNIVCIGSGITGADTTSFSVRITTFSEDASDINISNVTTDNSSYAIFLDATAVGAGAMKRVNISNVVGTDMGRVVLIDGGADSGSIDGVSFNNFNFEEVSFRPFEIKGNSKNISVNNFKASNILGATFLSSAFQVNPEVVGVKLNSIDLTEDNNPLSLGTVNFANSYENNFISGNNLFNLGGVGIPKDGYQTNASTGTAITITPKYTSKNKSVSELNASGTRTVTTISKALPSGTNFPENYELTIINNASGTATIQHGAGGFIYNRGAVNVNISPNEILKYIFVSNLWRQV